MKYHDLTSSLRVPYIGQGFGGIRDGSKSSNLEEEIYIKSLITGIENGLTLIDTAEAYAEGYSEELIGKAVLGRRADVQIATKFSPENNYFNDVIKSAEKSLKRLQTDYIDLYQIHWPNPMVPIAETISAMEHLVLQGKVLSIGVSNFSTRDLKEASSVLTSGVIVTNQVEYNLFDRFIEESQFPFCRDNNIKIIAYSPLDKGRTTDGDLRHQLLSNLSAKYSRTVEQIALNWLTTSEMVIAIPTSRSQTHIIENSQSLDFSLSIEDRNRIDIQCAATPEYIDPKQISVSLSGEGNRLAYQTISEAIENKLGLCPSPLELAEFIKNGDPIKPVRLILSKENGNVKTHDLVEGRLRYWAWVLAFSGEKAVPAYVRYD